MKHIGTILLLIILHFSFSPTAAQSLRCHYTKQDSILIEKLLRHSDTSVLNYARQFLGKPYVAHTLELYPDDERLVLNTSELDCTTYVDVVAGSPRGRRSCRTPTPAPSARRGTAWRRR